MVSEVPAAWRSPPAARRARMSRWQAGSEPTRAGARRAERPKRQFQPRLAAIAAAAVVSLVAWGFLVWAAIDFGRSARGGDGTAWVFLAIASLGAVACLFLSLMLATMLLRAVGSSRRSGRTSTDAGSSGPRAAARTSGPTRSRRSPRP